jgi:predicted DNA-binding protein
MQSIKFSAPLVVAFELEKLAKQQGRSVSEVVRLVVERGLTVMPDAKMPEAVCDRMERGSPGSKAVAAYLSPPLSRAIQRLANEQERSASWVMRLLIRESLRARGLLPIPEHHQLELPRRSIP